MSNREILEVFVAAGLMGLQFCAQAMVGAAIGNAIAPVVMEEIRKEET